MLSGLEPKSVWKFFFEISAIPRQSKHEEKLIKYIIAFAEKRGLKYKKDAAGNVVISKKASKGREKSPCVVLQSHIDMVCEKNEGTKHDFLKDPLQLYEEKGFIRAKGTTLGADDGIGVAASLAVLDSKDISHGAVECLFTVDEETGLTGANALGKDFIKGSMMLNLDSEEEGAVYIGCAGGKTTTMTKKLKTVKNDKNYSCRITVDGLKGGHSGLAIDKGHGNALVLLARVIWDMNRRLEFSLSEFSGGDKHNAIPREANAVINFNEKDLPAFVKKLKEFTGILRQENKKADGKVTVSCKKVQKSKYALSPSDKEILINMIYSFPNGVVSMSADIEGLVETSTNLAAVKADGTGVFILTSQRSSVESAIHDISGKVMAHAALSGYEYKSKDPYPAWTPDPASKLLKTAVEVHKDLFKKKPDIKAVHAGLECGIIGKKYPGIDMISFGPDVHGAHSPDEKVSIKSVGNFWNFLKNILEKL